MMKFVQTVKLPRDRITLADLDPGQVFAFEDDIPRDGSQQTLNSALAVMTDEDEYMYLESGAVYQTARVERQVRFVKGVFTWEFA